MVSAFAALADAVAVPSKSAGSAEQHCPERPPEPEVGRTAREVSEPVGEVDGDTEPVDAAAAAVAGPESEVAEQHVGHSYGVAAAAAADRDGGACAAASSGAAKVFGPVSDAPEVRNPGGCSWRRPHNAAAAGYDRASAAGKVAERDAAATAEPEVGIDSVAAAAAAVVAARTEPCNVRRSCCASEDVVQVNAVRVERAGVALVDGAAAAVAVPAVVVADGDVAVDDSSDLWVVVLAVLAERSILELVEALVVDIGAAPVAAVVHDVAVAAAAVEDDAVVAVAVEDDAVVAAVVVGDAADVVVADMTCADTD